MQLQVTNIEDTFRALRNRDPAKLSNSDIPRHDSYRPIPRQNYAPIAITQSSLGSGGMTKTASVASAGTIYGQPQFFSPVHTPINWQIPSKRLEQYQWARFFYENEPKVASAIDFYSYFPMSDWEHECRDRNVKIYFDNFKKRLNLTKWCRLMSHEIHLLGDCFPFIEISCPICGGHGMMGDEVCDHEGGTVNRMVILNPDFVDVHTPPLNPDPIIALRPDEELINMVQRKTPGYDRLSPEVIALVSSGQPIRLDNRNVSHLKYGESGYSRYGIGMVRRLFPILSYKTKLMVAQWIVAERLIVPIKIVKVGSDERPAGPADIAAVQSQLAETANDPNLTIVTHHAFEFDFMGACHDDQTEVLTENGWKKYSEVSKGYDEKIATYSLDNNCLEYQTPIEYHEYDFDGDLCLFEGQNVSTCVTPNHKMLVSKSIWDCKKDQYINKEWGKARADGIRRNDKFKITLDWEGEIPENPPYKQEHRLNKLNLHDYLEFLGYYLSEGSIKVDKGYSTAVQVCQCNNSSCFDDMKKSIYKFGKVQETFQDRSANGHSDCTYWVINDSQMSREMQENYGHKAPNKFIPNWILGLPQIELRVILNALMAGDGNVRFSEKGDVRYKYTTTSKLLADNVQEIVFKLGYSPMITVVEKTKEHYHDTYIVYWSELRSSKGYTVIKDRHIKRQTYNGKVWCFTVLNGYFITRRNGKIGIHGNSGKVLTLSNEFEFINQEVLDGMMINNALLNGEGPTFASASVGIEAMIQRLETFRNQITEWILEFLYLPEAKRKGFTDENPETGEVEYVVPKIKWNSMHLRDQQQYRTFILQLYEKGLVSAQTCLEAFDIDPDQEIERKRYDAVQMMALGQGVGGSQQGGEMGGGFGGGMGGLDLGGPPMGDLGGEPPIAPGGGMGAPEGGDIPMGKTAPLTAEVADPSQFGGKVLKKKTRDKLVSDQKQMYSQQPKPSSYSKGADGQIRDEKGRIAFTKIERDLMDSMIKYQKDGIIKYPIVPQYKLMIGNVEHPVDFAIPHLKIILEADGEIFHSSPKQIQKDQERDRKLAQMGWTVLRFKDSEIEKQPQQVMSKIVQTIMQKEMSVKENTN